MKTRKKRKLKRYSITTSHREIEFVPLVLSTMIKDMRKELNLTQAELAKTMGVTQTHLSQVENGKYGLGPDTLAKLMKALGISLYYRKDTKLKEVK